MALTVYPVFEDEKLNGLDENQSSEKSLKTDRTNIIATNFISEHLITLFRSNHALATLIICIEFCEIDAKYKIRGPADFKKLGTLLITDESINSSDYWFCIMYFGRLWFSLRGIKQARFFFIFFKFRGRSSSQQKNSFRCL